MVFTDPVEITLPADGGQINVTPARREFIDELHPVYKKSVLVSNAAAASRLIITGSDMVSNVLRKQADTYTKNNKPSAKTMTFKPATRERIRRINTFTDGAVHLSSKTVGQIGKVAQNFGATLGGHKKSGGGAPKGYGPDGEPLDTYKPGLLNKSIIAFSTVMDGVEQAGRNLLTSGSTAATTVVEHKWGPDAGEISKAFGGGATNAGLVYIDVTGVSRRAILKSVAKGMVVGHTSDGNQVIVGGGEGDANMGPDGKVDDKVDGKVNDTEPVDATNIPAFNKKPANGTKTWPQDKKT